MAEVKQRKLTLEQIAKQINKEFGDIAKTGSDIPQNVEIICSTGSYSLDVAIGCNGIPRGRIIEIKGPESGGKTLKSLIMISQVQKVGGTAAFIDIEGTYTHSWAQNFGVNTKQLLYVKPKSGGEVFDIMLVLIENGIDIIVTDSVAVLMTKAEEEAESDQSMMAQVARLLSFNLKRIQNKLNSTGSQTCVVLINQLRSDIGSYGNPEKGTGGWAMRFYPSIALNVKRGETIGDKDDPIGFKTKIKCVKNKCGRPFRQVEVDLYIGPEKYGIDNDAEIIDVAEQLDIIQRLSKNKEGDGEEKFVSDRKGSHYFYKCDKFSDEPVYGKPKLIKFFKDNPDEIQILKTRIEEEMDNRYKPEPGSFDAITQGIEETEE